MKKSALSAFMTLNHQNTTLFWALLLFIYLFILLKKDISILLLVYTTFVVDFWD